MDDSVQRSIGGMGNKTFWEWMEMDRVCDFIIGKMRTQAWITTVELWGSNLGKMRRITVKFEHYTKELTNNN